MSYLELMQDIDKLVEEERNNFLDLTPKRKIINISVTINKYIDAKNSANIYLNKSRNNSEYEKKLSSAEYVEMLNLSRLKLRVKLLNEKELNLYVDFIQSKLEEALSESNMKKRFRLYDYIHAACSVVVDNGEVMSRIEEIKSSCKQIVEDIKLL